MCTYVWKNLDVGYIQGMCDLVAPLLVIFDDGRCFTMRCYADYPSALFLFKTLVMITLNTIVVILETCS